MAIYADPNQFKGFDEVVRKKREELANKANQKKARISQGTVPFLNEWATTSATFDDMAGKGTDADSGYLTTSEGAKFGARANDIDTPEHSSYRKEAKLRQYQKDHYAKLWGIDPSQVNSAMVYEMGKKADESFNSLATEGQGKYNAEMGVVERSPEGMEAKYDAEGNLIDGMEAQWYLPKTDVTYDSDSKRWADSKRIKSTLTNPETGVDLYAAMNTPEFNTRWFDDNSKQNAIREAYEAKHGNKYEEFKGLDAVPDVVSERMKKVAIKADAARAMGTKMREDQNPNIPAEVVAAGRDSRVSLITNNNSFAVYFPEREGKVGFYKDALTLKEAQWYKKEIEANPDAVAEVNSWANVGNELKSGGVSVSEGFKRALDDGPLTRLEGVDQWNQLVGTHTNWWQSPQNRHLRQLGHTGEQSSDVNPSDIISKEDQANHRFIEAKQALGGELTEEELLFTQQNKYAYLSSVDKRVVERVARDQASLSTEQEAASKVNRREAGFEKRVAEEIYDDSGWDYLVYSLQNRKMSAAHSLVESAAFMGQLMVPYVGMATAIATAQENNKREYTKLNGKVPEGADAVLLNSLSVIQSMVEKLGLKAITGKLPGLTKWVSEIGIKNPLLANIVKPIVAVGAPATIEGISGLTSTVAETVAKHGIQEDGSLVTPTGFEASEAFVNEAMAGASISTPITAGRAVIQNDVVQNKVIKKLLPEKAANFLAPNLTEQVDKIAKRADILKDDTLTEKQRVTVEKSRDKLVNNLVNQRDTKIKGFQAKYADTRKDSLEVDAYLDELNTIATAEKGLDRSKLDSMHVAQLSYALLDTLKQNKKKEAIDFKLIAGLEKGLKRYENQIEIDMAIATAGNFTSTNADTVDTVNAAKERIRAHEKLLADNNIRATTEDYQQLITEQPHKEGLFNTKRDEAIASINVDLEQTLTNIGKNIVLGKDAKTEEVQEAKETNRLRFTPVAGVDVKSSKYDPLKAVTDIIFSKEEGAELSADESIALLEHRKNLNTVVAAMRREGKTDAEIKNYIDILDESQYILEDIAAKQVERSEVDPKSKINANDSILHSLNIEDIDSETVGKLEENSEDLTDEQKALLETQKKRLEIDKRRVKNQEDVSHEIMNAETGDNQSFDGYAKQAQEGKATKRVLNRLNNFANHMENKAEVLTAALETSKQDGVEAVFINKSDLNAEPIVWRTGEAFPEGVKLEDDNVNKPVSHYAIKQSNGSTITEGYSKPLVESTQVEAEYGRATQKLIKQVFAAKEAAKLDANNYSNESESKISVLLDQQKLDAGDLGDIGKANTEEDSGEIVDLISIADEANPNSESDNSNEFFGDTNEIIATPPLKQDDEKDEAGQTESAEAEAVPAKVSKDAGIESDAEVENAEPTSDTTMFGTDADNSTSKGINKEKATEVAINYVDEIISSVDGKTRIAAKTDRKNNTILIDKAEVQATFKRKAWMNSRMEGVKPYAADAFETVEEWETFLVAHERAHFTKENLKRPQGPSRENHANAVAMREVKRMRKAPVKAKTKVQPEVKEPEIAPEVKPSETFVVGLTGDTILSNNTQEFVPVLNTSSGNAIDLLEVKDKKREIVRVFTPTGEITGDTIKAQAEAAVEKVNEARVAEGKDPIAASPEYIETVTETFKQFKKIYETANKDTKGNKKSIIHKSEIDEGVNSSDVLNLLHIVDSNGKETLPDEVLFALATQALSYISTDASTLKNLDDVQIKRVLGLNQKDKLTNQERLVIKAVGVPLYMMHTNVGANVINALNIKAKAKRSKGLSAYPLSPLELQDNLTDALGLLALTLLSQVDAAAILPKYISKQSNPEPFVILKAGVPIIKKRAEGNDVFIGNNTVNTIQSNAHSNGIDPKEHSEALTFLRGEAGHLEAITGLEVSKSGVYSAPVKEVQTKISGSLSPVSSVDQAIIRKLQDTPQKGMSGPLRAWRALSTEQKEEVAGVVDVETKHWDRKESYEASNAALRSEIDSMEEYQDDIFFYKYGVQKQGRMMIKSAGINPQNSTIHRHLVAAESNPTTVDTPRLRNAFKVAVAAAFGAPIDKQGAVDSVRFFESVYKNAVVKAAVAVLKDNNASDAEIAKAIMSVHNLKDADGKALYANKVHLVEGLAGLADYRPRAAFTTNMTAEIDGITNGYAIALLQFGGHNLMASLQRVGVYDGKLNTEFGEWIQDPDNSDVYQELAKAMNSARNVSAIAGYQWEAIQKANKKGNREQAKRLGNTYNRLTKNEELKPGILHALEEAHGEILRDGTLTSFARDLAKDPLMTTNYGAALASVLRKVSDSAIEDILDKLADIQQNYNNGNVEEATKDAQRLDAALNALRGVETEFGFVELLKKNTLDAALFTTLPVDSNNKNRKTIFKTAKANEKIIREIQEGIEFVYAPMMEAGLKELLGDPENPNSLMGRRMELGNAFEWIFYFYLDAYNEQIEAIRKASNKNRVSPEQKREVARSLLGTYYPRYKGPVHQEDTEADSFIAMISQTKSPDQNKRIPVKLEHYVYTHSTDTEGVMKWDKNQTKRVQLSAAAVNNDPTSGGSKVQANIIQNMDARHIGRVSEQFEFLTLYDAGIFSIKDLDAGSGLYNNDFIKSNLDNNILGVVLEELKAVALLGLKDGRTKRVTNMYRSESHQAKNTGLIKVRYSLSINKQIKALDNAHKGALRDLEEVRDLFEKDELVVNQMNWADLSKVEAKNAKLGSSNESASAKIENITSRSSLSHLTQDIFDNLNKVFNDVYSSPEEARLQREHLERILQKFIIPSAALLDSTSIDIITRKTDKSGGNFNPETGHVEVNVGRYKPRTFTQQTPQEVYIHELIHAISFRVIKTDSKIRNELNRLHREMRKEVTWEDFMHPEASADIAAEEKAAKDLYNYLFGDKGKEENAPYEFLAYALTNPGMIRKLQATKTKKHTDEKVKSPLKRFFNLLNRILTSFQEEMFANRKHSSTVYDQIFNLAEEVIAINTDRRNALSRFLFRKGISAKHSAVNQKIIDFQDKVINKGIPKLHEVAQRRRDELRGKVSETDNVYSKIVKGVLVNLPLAALQLTPKEMRRYITNAHYVFKGEVAKTMRSLMREVAGITPQEFLDMVLESRHAVDANRAQTKEAIAKILRKSFVSEAEPTELELEALTALLLKTDAVSLLDQGLFKMEQIVELIRDPKRLTSVINKYSKLLNTAGNTYYALEINGLSDYMVTGETETSHQYLNAYSIALDDKGDTKDEHNIDVLATLQAIQKTIQNTSGMQEAVINLADREMAVNKEFNGFTEMLLQHRSFKAESIKELFGNDKALMNKGYIAVITDADTDIIVEPLLIPDIDRKGNVRLDSRGQPKMIDNVAVLKRKGYTKVENLKGITGIDQTSLALFVGTNVVEVPRTKGINSVTSRKAKGTSLKEIIARNPEYEGMVKRMLGDFFTQENAKEAKQLKTGKSTGKKQLIPIVNSKNEITDYRVGMSHAMVKQHLKQDLNSIEIMSTMFMRKADKAATLKVNDRSVDLMIADADKNRTNKNAKKWVNLFDIQHKAEYFDTLPKQMRFKIESNITYSNKGKKEFWVQEGLLDTIFGYKHRTMMNLPLIRDMHATRRITGLVEKAIKGLVKTAVVAIVVKIPMVLRDNITSNIFASIVHGLPPTYLTKHINRGWQELETYRDNMEELAELRHRVAARPELAKKPVILKKMKELASDINSSDMHMFMSSGLFTSITEDIHGFDMQTRSKSGKWLKDKTGMTIPKSVSNVFSMAYMSPDSKVGRAAMHATQISDFLFRYAMYKHKTEQQGATHAEAWKLITRLFVNYDQPMNRNIQYMNDLGIIMFVRYFLRIQSMVTSMARKEPLNLIAFLATEVGLDADFADITDSSILSGKLLPTDGGIAKILKEVIIPPAWEIGTGEGW